MIKILVPFFLGKHRRAGGELDTLPAEKGGGKRNNLLAVTEGQTGKEKRIDTQ